MEPLLNDKHKDDSNGYGTNAAAPPGMSLNNDGQHSDGSGEEENKWDDNRTRDRS